MRRITHNDIHIRLRIRHLLQSNSNALLQAWTQQQVFRWVTGQYQFRKQNDACTLRFCCGDTLQYKMCIARNVSDYRIDLSQCDVKSSHKGLSNKWKVSRL